MVDLVHWIKDAIHTAQTKVNSDVKSCVDSERLNDSDSKSSSGRSSSPSSSFHPGGENKVGPADSKGDDSIEAVEKLMQRQTLGSSDKSSNDQQILSGGGGESPCAIPFTIERTDEASASRYATPKFIIRYAVPIQ